MRRIFKLALLVSIGVCITAWAGIAAAESEEARPELQNYFSNANTTGGQAFVNITSPLEGNLTATDPTVREAETCAMIYVFNAAQAMQACCGCPVTADGLLTLNVTTQLANNPAATQTLLRDGTIRILSSLPNASLPTTIPDGWGCDPSTGVCCDPTAASTGYTLTPGNELVAWATHIQNTQVTEDEFQAEVPGSDELGQLPAACADTLDVGSGSGGCLCSVEVPTPTPPPTATATPTVTANPDCNRNRDCNPDRDCNRNRDCN